MVPHFCKVLCCGILLSCSVLFGQSTGSYAAMYTDQMSGTPLADGSLYAPQRVVMSHPYFPFGAKVKITNLQTHLVTEAFVADRPGLDEQNLVMISRKVAEAIGINAGEVKLIDIQVLQFDVPAPQSPTQLSSRAAMVEPAAPPPYQPQNMVTVPQQQAPQVYNRPPIVNTIPPPVQQIPQQQAPPVYNRPVTVPPPVYQAPPVYNRPPVNNTLPPANTQPSYVPLPNTPVNTGVVYASPTVRPNTNVIAPVSNSGDSGANFLQQGIASYYGDQFQGKLTANGEVFNKHDMTAAHQGLPFNSIIRVTVVETGKYVDVRVNDRGPYVGPRILDLSEKAAKDVGLFRKGTAEVRITLLRGPRGETTVAQLTQRFSAADPRVQGQGGNFSPRNLIIPEFTIQLGAYRVFDQAQTAAQQINGAWVETSEQDGRVVYRLNFKHFPNRDDANRGLREAQNLGYTGFVRQVVH